MAALVTVEDRRRRQLKGLIYGAKDECHVERVVEVPTNHETREPVNDGNEVKPTGRHADVRYVNSPNVICFLGNDAAQKVR